MIFNLIPKVFAAEAIDGPCGAGYGGIDLGNCLKLSDSTKVSDVYSTPADLVNLIVRNLFLFSGVIIVAMFILAAFKFISKGSKGIEEARGILTMAITGFLIMFSAYWIVQIVSLLTGVNVPGVTIQSSSIDLVQQAYAQTDEEIIGKIDVPPGVEKFNNDAGENNIAIVLFISNMIKLATIIAGLWVGFNVIYAGYLYLTSGGKADVHSNVSNLLTMSVLGLVLIISSYMFAGLVGFLIFGDASFIINPKIDNL